MDSLILHETLQEVHLPLESGSIRKIVGQMISASVAATEGTSVRQDAGDYQDDSRLDPDQYIRGGRKTDQPGSFRFA